VLPGVMNKRERDKSAHKIQSLTVNQTRTEPRAETHMTGPFPHIARSCVTYRLQLARQGYVSDYGEQGSAQPWTVEDDFS
jgi:hypothetical protein